MNIFSLLLSKFNHITKYDKTKLIMYGSISIIVYYFLEKFEFRKLALIIIIFFTVFFIYNQKEVQDTLIDSKDKDKEKVKEKILKLKIKNKQLKDNVDIEQLNQNIQKIEEFININIKDVIPTSSSFINNNNKEIKTNYKDLLALLDIYLQEIEAILEIKEYKHKNFEKLLDIKKEININIHSLFFQIDLKRDDEIGILIKNINITFKNIEDFLREFINNHFQENPNFLNGSINEETNTPRSFDKTQDDDCYLVEF